MTLQNEAFVLDIPPLAQIPPTVCDALNYCQNSFHLVIKNLITMD